MEFRTSARNSCSINTSPVQCSISWTARLRKTSIIHKAAEEAGIVETIMENPANKEPVHYSGMGARSQDGKCAEFLLFEQMQKLIYTDKPTLVFFDDIGQALDATQKSLMPILLDRRVGHQPISKTVSIVGATNDRHHKSGASVHLEPVKSRFPVILHMKSDYKVWRRQFGQKNINSFLLAI